MGNYKFKLTDIIPNAWLYKLMCMRHKGSKNQSMPRSKRRSLQSSPRLPPSSNAGKLLPNRASYYVSSRAEASDAQLLLDPPRRSKRMSRVKPIIRASATTGTLLASSATAGCGCRSWKTESIPEFSLSAFPESPPGQRDYYIEGDTPPELHKTNTSRGFDADAANPCSHSCSCKITSSPTDIIIDVNVTLPEKLKEVTMQASEIELPPILTKPANKDSDTVKFENDSKSHNINATPVKTKSRIQERRSSFSPPGLHRLRLRTSPRLASKKTFQSPRRVRKRTVSTPPPASAMQQGKGISKSFAVVKSSSDPKKDFRESMLEMIVENDMRTSKDLENLLTCYLLLNSSKYHDIIVDVFQQIWFDLTNITL